MGVAYFVYWEWGTSFGRLQPTIVWIFFILAPAAFLPGRSLIPPHYTFKERAAGLRVRMEALEAVLPNTSSSSAEATVPLQHTLGRYLLTSVDKFVDEAQDVLTARARVYFAFGAAAFFGVIATLHVAFIFAKQALDDAKTMTGRLEHPTHHVALRIFAALAVAAAIFGVVKALVWFGRSFFHEATRLLDRRHALRFGRLYMYLRGEQFQFKEMQEAFQWHMESRTVFQDISADSIGETATTQVMKTVGTTAEAIGKTKDAVASPKG